ncbi:MAG: cell division protein FtsA [Candidatus Doudnabacteria bacterium RIFCSPHIGHO2_02_FULL_48_21]|uniref:Cell division protein FtsA n=1 Tax=Candidatus Doudnabacteria bacterium RIFCSPLOWO2_02_FULL_48_13 TaxID=1817845 RepID=A0A1F5QAB2_9BACT|nr:MAG: cell division protein FtsA [Candidatus Doudnabacteria bacterium RIFCSPHIGHO2_01_48_18]OGE78038.1 MAG: cell division protein FtsA [Candidatus Doudnabacteria bacterium RIFCSPHIGHO2_01_FULL_48_180]OGE91363.1 MAG: cell division protein FtsA [Candidatus Doudnabacteria bacterium RIFCSPHIGHO2_12_FULL_47_25]OGE93175.1 MAG: cell division protein FtsA [Candidatus Doudnabacteria bacterium RIFCSPHIGHO2_02_FULL_48_21]OGE96696.1 MAG: cell division protein FtsA [Candidatus Doudnabacteria bacterium RIF
MSSEQILVGLDIGTTTIRVVVGKKENPGTPPSIIGVGEAKASGIRKGVIVDIEEAVSSISKALEKAERMTGIPTQHAVVSVGGAHVVSLESHGVIAVARADGEITENDVVRVIDAAQAIQVPTNREILHVIPKDFTVDGQTGIKDPVGMTGIRLEVDAQIIEASIPFIKNLTKCVIQAGIDIDDLVLAPLASAQAVLTKRQKELGVVLIELGGGTTGLVAFEESELLHTNILAVGSDHITNDIAIGLRTSVDVADTVKLEYGRAMPTAVKKDEVINLSKIDKNEEGQVSRLHLTEIIQARLEEIFSMVNKELKAAGRDGQLPAGAVLTGGGAKLQGIVELAKKELRLPVQIGYPLNISTIIDRVDDPAYATAVGLVLWADEYLASDKAGMGRFASKILQNASIDKIRKFFKQFLP